MKSWPWCSPVIVLCAVISCNADLNTSLPFVPCLDSATNPNHLQQNKSSSSGKDVAVVSKCSSVEQFRPFADSHCYCADTLLGDVIFLPEFNISTSNSSRFLYPFELLQRINSSQQSRLHVKPSALCVKIEVIRPALILGNQVNVQFDDHAMGVPMQFPVPFSGCYSSPDVNDLLGFDIFCNARETCEVNVTFAYYGHNFQPLTPTTAPPLPTAMSPLPTTVPPEVDYTPVGRLERTFIQCSSVYESESVLFPGNCLYSCWSSLQAFGAGDPVRSLMFRPLPISNCYCDKFTLIADLVGNVVVVIDDKAFKFDSFNVTTVALDANSQILQSDVHFPSQTCRMIYQVVSGTVMGASRVHESSDSSVFTHKDEGSLVGVIFCAILVVGGLALFIRRKIRERRVAKLLRKKSACSDEGKLEA